MAGTLKTRIGRAIDLGQALRWSAAQSGRSTVRVGFDMLRRQVGRQGLSGLAYFLFGSGNPAVPRHRHGDFPGEEPITDPNAALVGPPQHGLNGPLRATAMTGALLTRAVLADGREVSARALAEEIARTCPDGCLFEDPIRPHPDHARLTAPTLGTLRIVTLAEAAGPGVLHAVARLPVPGAMADDVGAGLPTPMRLDPATGRFIRSQHAWRIGGFDAETVPVTGAPLAGAVVPMVPDAAALAPKVQGLFAAHRIPGLDIGLSADGPVVVGANPNPFHALWQRAAMRGRVVPGTAPRLAARLPPTHPLRRSLRQPA